MLNFVQLKNLVEQDFCLNFEHQNGGYALPRSTGPLGVGPACRRFIWRAESLSRRNQALAQLPLRLAATRCRRAAGGYCNGVY